MKRNKKEGKRTNYTNKRFNEFYVDFLLKFSS